MFDWQYQNVCGGRTPTATAVKPDSFNSSATWHRWKAHVFLSDRLRLGGRRRWQLHFLHST